MPVLALVHVVLSAFMNPTLPAPLILTVPELVQFLPIPAPAPVILVVPLVVNVPAPTKSEPVVHSSPLKTKFPVPPIVSSCPALKVKGLVNVSGTLKLVIPPVTLTLPVPAIPKLPLTLVTGAANATLPAPVTLEPAFN